MKKKSDRAARLRLSATEASRSFSKLLDDVGKGRQFTIYRHGRDICVIAPPAPATRRASECLETLRQRSPVTLDDAFGEDLLAVLAEEAIEERPSWES